MKLSVLAKETKGKLHGLDRNIVGVTTDSRHMQNKDLFVALKGNHHDGHDYIASALAKGAKAVLAQRGPISPQEKAVPFLQVADTTLALGQIAAYWRRCQALPLVGLTGSCGKTTVKNMIALICEQQGHTLATAGNLNNQIGVPLTLLRLHPDFEFAVVEMGASKQAEIGYLAKMAQPTVALVTNVLPAHLEGFGSLDEIAHNKGQIYDHVAAKGTAVFNIEEPYAKTWQAKWGNRHQVTFGLSQKAMVYASDITYDPFSVRFTLHFPKGHTLISVPVPGEQTVMNALAAAAVCWALGISIPHIQAGLASFSGVGGRLQGFRGWGKAWIIDDSYNANPASVKAALEVLARFKGERVFVMGEMGELGEKSADYHAQIGHYARDKGIEQLWAIGDLSAKAAHAFGQGRVYESQQALIVALKAFANPNAIILIKGSRFMRMERVADALKLDKKTLPC